MSEKFSYDYTVQFSGVVIDKNEKIRHMHRIFDVRADSSLCAIEHAKARVNNDEALRGSYYHSYRIKSVN